LGTSPGFTNAGMQALASGLAQLDYNWQTHRKQGKRYSADPKAFGGSGRGVVAAVLQRVRLFVAEMAVLPFCWSAGFGKRLY